MPTRNELKELAKLRLAEAETLYHAGYYDGATYLCGYAVEFALKARICRLLGVSEYPPPISGPGSGRIKSAYTVHDFDQLLLLSGLQPKLDPTQNPSVWQNWSIATPWNPENRYNPKGTISQVQAEEMLEAVKNKPDGVLSWIMKFW